MKKKKTFKLEKYYKLFIQSLFEWDFSFFRNIDFFLDDFWSNFSFSLGQFAVFARNT